jgi:hypothetical protein
MKPFALSLAESTSSYFNFLYLFITSWLILVKLVDALHY